MKKSLALIPTERIQKQILLLRGQKVILSQDLAELYGVPAKALNQAVKRNRQRFPDDFMFQLDHVESESLRSQTVTSSWGGARVLPYAFTEQGVAMLSSVLRSERAVQVNIAIMLAFVQLREILGSRVELARKLNELERKLGGHDSAIQFLFEAIRQLMTPPVREPKPEIGFHIKEDTVLYRTKRKSALPR